MRAKINLFDVLIHFCQSARDALHILGNRALDLSEVLHIVVYQRMQKVKFFFQKKFNPGIMGISVKNCPKIYIF